MSGDDSVLLVRSGRIATVTLNRPHQLNAINQPMLGLLRSTFEQLGGDTTVDVIVVTGSGDRAFSVGADIAELSAPAAPSAALSSEMQHLYNLIEELPQPTIAAINGYALGGGLELALACDIRVAATGARLALPELGLSVLPAAGGLTRLTRLIGRGRTAEFVFTGQQVPASVAEAIGIVNHIWPEQELLSEVHALAQVIVAKGPLAVRLSKLVMRHGENGSLHTGLALESLAQAILFGSTDKAEGTAAFLEKRAPQFNGR